MRKSLLFALTGALLFALVSCGTKESKQFKATKAGLENIQQKMDAVTSCEDLDMLGLELLSIGFNEDNYADNEKMTAEEMEKINELMDAFSKKAVGKSADLGCNEVVEEEVDMVMDTINDVAMDLVDSIAMP